MADIIDIQVRDQGTTTAAKNMERLGVAADQAAKATKGLQDALKLVSRGDFKKAQSGLADASASLAKAQRDATTSASTLSNAQIRSLQAEQKLLLARQKVATETARTQVQMAKLATEQARAAQASANQALAVQRLTNAQNASAAAAAKAAQAQTAASTAASTASTASNRAATATQNFTNQQKKLAGAAEANRMHMVNVSYQLQDIAVGLASGQRPMTVFIQQGAQLYGIAQMMNVSLGQLAKQIAVMSAKFLANPIVLMTAAIVGAALATERYVSMSKDFGTALDKTNNYVGLAKQNFDALAESIAKASGGSFSQAAAAMTAVAASGKIAGSRFEEISIIATKMQRTVGTAVEDTIATYADLGKAPLETLLKLNETERFLTAEQYKRIDALEQTGQKTQAVTEAIQIYMANQERMAANVEASRGPAMKFWDDLTTKISNATTALGSYLATMADQSVTNWGQVGTGFSQLFNGQFGAGLKNIDAGIARELYGDGEAVQKQNAELADLTRRYHENRAAVEAAQKAEQARQISMLQGQKELREYTGTLDKKVARQLEEVKVTGLVAKAYANLTDAQKKAKVAALMSQYDAKNATKTPKGPSDGSQEILDRLRKQNVLNEARLDSEQKLTESQRLLAIVQDYLDEKGKSLSASRRKEITDYMELVKASGERKDALEKEAAAQERRLRLDNVLRKQEANQADANSMSILGMTSDSDTVDRVRRKLDIDRWYAEELDKLRQDNYVKDENERATAELQLKESYARRIEQEKQYQAQVASIRDDWRVVMNQAVQEYVRNMTDGARQTKELMTDAFKGAEDAFVRFVTTGKFSFKDFANTVVADLARIAAQKAIAGVVGAIFGGMSGTGAAGAGVGSTQLGNNYGWGGRGFGSANGNAFAGGTGLSASSNRVVNGYREFQFANGGAFTHNASMSEKGAEAVMPLTRDSSGRLGVNASGSGNIPNVNITIVGGDGDKTADANASIDSSGNLNIEVMMRKAASAEIATQFGNRSGPAYKALTGTFGLKPQVG